MFPADVTHIASRTVVSMLSAASSALVASARPAFRVSRTSAARTARRAPRAFTANGKAFWDKMVAKASGKSGETTETAVFALG